LYGKRHLLASSLPFLYGGDMIADGQVYPDRVGYNALPWKYAAGTPNILGTVVSAQALRILLDPEHFTYFGAASPIERATVHTAMTRIHRWNEQLTARALDGLGAIGALTVCRPRDAAPRTSPVALNRAGRDPLGVADARRPSGVALR